MHVHFSIDDVFDSLIDDNHPMVDFVNDIGYPLDLYCFYQNKEHNLSDVSINNFKEYVRFGAHGLDNDTPPHSQSTSDQEKVFNKIYSEFDRLGCNYSNQVRLHEFSESYELSEYFINNGIERIFTTDKDALLWRVPDTFKHLIKRNGYCDYNGIRFVQTNIRVENLIDKTTDDVVEILDDVYHTKEYPNVMTHEYELIRPEVRDMTRFILDYLTKKEMYYG